MRNPLSRRLATCLLLAITLLGLGARLNDLTARSLWFDEAFSWRLIQFPFEEMMQRAAQDVHPPLYYLLLKAWQALFFSSLLSLRLFSVAWAAGSFIVGYLLMLEVAQSRSASLLAAALLALSGWQIQYAGEARMYTLGITLALLAAWLLLKAVRTGRLVLWVAYAGTAAAFAYVHYFAVFTLLAHGLFVIGWLIARTRGRPGEILLQPRTWQALLSAGLVVLLYLPWLPQALEQNTRVQGGYWVPPLNVGSVPATFYRMLVPTAAALPHRGLAALLSVLPFLFALIAATIVVRAKTHPGRDGRWLLVLCAFLPFVGAVAVSLLGRSLYQDRFLAFAHPFIVLFIAQAASMIKARGLRASVAAVLIIGFFFAAVRYSQELDIKSRPGARAAAQHIVEHRAPDEPVLASSPFIFFPLDFYFTEAHAVPRTVKLHTAGAPLLHFAGAPILTPEDASPPDFLETTAATSLWVADTTGFGAAPLALTPDWRPAAAASFPEVFAYQGTVTVTRYVRLP